VQQRDERDGREDLAALADEARELRDDGHLPGREPGCHEAQDADEHHRVAAADQDPREDRCGERVRERQRDLTDRHDGCAGRDHRARTDPVEQHADRHLHAGVDQQLHDGEGAEHRGGDLETLRGVETGDPQRRTLQHPDGVGGDTDAPHQPRASRGPVHPSILRAAPPVGGSSSGTGTSPSG